MEIKVRGNPYDKPIGLPDVARLRTALNEFNQRATAGSVVNLAAEVDRFLKAFEPGTPFGYALAIVDSAPYQWFHLGLSLRCKPQVGIAPRTYEIDGLMLQRPPHDPFYNGG